MGYGSVVKLSGNRRRPYWVRKTLGFKDNGQPIYETVGYAASKEEGMMMLAEFNKDPYDFKRKVTLKEVYETWVKYKAPRFSKNTTRSMTTAYNHAHDYWNIDYLSIKSLHMQALVNEQKSPSSQNRIRTFFNHMDKMAKELDLPVRGYASTLITDAQTESTREPFTTEMIESIWNAYSSCTEPESKHTLEDILILLYTGLRVNEFLSLTNDSYDVKENWIKCGSKSRAGRNRIIPIHEKIKSFILKRLESGWSSGNDYIFRNKFHAELQKLGFDKIPHECRHTFETELDNQNGNRKAINLLMGHASSDVGNRVYNHKTLEQLRETIALISY